MQDETTKLSADTHRSAPELSRPSTRSSLASIAGLRPISRAGTIVSDDVSSGTNAEQGAQENVILEKS